MECYYGISTENSNKTSDEYITVNNFGYFKDLDTDIITKRDYGRLDYQIIYIDKGCGSFLLDDKVSEIKCGNVILLRPGEKHKYTIKKNSCYYWIHFTGNGIEKLLKDLKLEGKIFETGDFFAFKETIDKMSKETVKNDFISNYMLSSNMFLLFSLTARKIYTPDSSMHKVVEKMQKDSSNKLSNEDYAKICGVSEYHFIRKFKAVMGMTPHQYKIKLVIDKAIDMLSTTNLNISEVSHILGFDDSLYFSRVFKKEMGVSPQKYISGKRNI